jgi:hypothetical protein
MSSSDQFHGFRVAESAWNMPINTISWLSASLWGPFPRVAPLRNGAGAGRFKHGEWEALLQRFVQNGTVDYPNFARVRRLVEVYLERIAQAEPDDFADADDQLAFYLNAYNAIVIHQILLHYPIRSVAEIKAMFLRPYPVGRRNLSLNHLHSTFLRAYGDPRIHAAIHLGARSGAKLRFFSGAELQRALDLAMRQLLADDTNGMRYNAETNTLYLSPLLRWFAGDFVKPYAMPRPWHLLEGAFQPDQLATILAPYMPESYTFLPQQAPRVQALPFNWMLNEQYTQ